MFYLIFYSMVYYGFYVLPFMNRKIKKILEEFTDEEFYVFQDEYSSDTSNNFTSKDKKIKIVFFGIFDEEVVIKISEKNVNVDYNTLPLTQMEKDVFSCKYKIYRYKDFMNFKRKVKVKNSNARSESLELLD